MTTANQQLIVSRDWEPITDDVLEILYGEIENLAHLSSRTRQGLIKNNVRTLKSLVQLTEEEILTFENFGKRSLKEIIGFLEELGLSLNIAIRRSNGDPYMRQVSWVALPKWLSLALEKPIEEMIQDEIALAIIKRLRIRRWGDLLAADIEEKCARLPLDEIENFTTFLYSIQRPVRGDLLKKGANGRWYVNHESLGA